MVIDLIIWLWSLGAFPSPIGQCDPPGERLEWTRSERNEVRRIVQDTATHLGASYTFRMYLDAVTVRESSGAASRWHDGGAGLGAHGVNLSIHASRWPEPLNPAICDPRVSTMVVQDLAASCIARRGASTIWELQSCFAGRTECIGGNPGTCTPEMMDRTTSAICSRMEQRGVECHARITLKDLGLLTPLAERPAMVRHIEETAK